MTIVTTPGIFIVNTIADLRAVASSSINQFAIVKGDTVAYDGGGGDYIWESAATNADDGVNWIKPNDKTNAQAGRWKKQI